jgi:uracil-DNA glycosylase
MANAKPTAWRSQCSRASGRPASLGNIFKELKEDVGIVAPKGVGDLTAWARQGVLLLNTILTVRQATPLSHKGRGWEAFTDSILRQINAGDERVVFVLWGGHAQKKRDLIDTSKHVVIESAHPSPLSARTGFFGSKPFSRINQALEGFGKGAVDWRL